MDTAGHDNTGCGPEASNSPAGGKPRCKMVLDEFVYKVFLDKGSPKAPQKISMDKDEFLAKVQQIYDKDSTVQLRDGYAPFCKHLFIPNFAGMLKCHMKITKSNEQALRTDYVARTKKELPVLSRWFEANRLSSDKLMQEAKYLDVILYSKEQIIKEAKAMNGNAKEHIDYDYGVVSVKPQDLNHEIPMEPITIIRNSLGKEHGGSGVPLDRDAYL